MNLGATPAGSRTVDISHQESWYLPSEVHPKPKSLSSKLNIFAHVTSLTLSGLDLPYLAERRGWTACKGHYRIA